MRLIKSPIPKVIVGIDYSNNSENRKFVAELIASNFPFEIVIRSSNKIEST